MENVTCTWALTFEIFFVGALIFFCRRIELNPFENFVFVGALIPPSTLRQWSRLGGGQSGRREGGGGTAVGRRR